MLSFLEKRSDKKLYHSQAGAATSVIAVGAKK